MDVRITFTGKIQENYGQYLTDIQDKFIERTLEYTAITEDTERLYSNTEKANIESELVKQNDILKELQKNPPNEDNLDYSNIYNDIMKIMAFYIQGETMQAEYIYGYKDKYLPDEEQSGKVVRLETYTMGAALCNVMGNMMLNNYRYINEVRNTNFNSKYIIMSIDEINGMSDAEYNSTLEELEKAIRE